MARDYQDHEQCEMCNAILNVWDSDAVEEWQRVSDGTCWVWYCPEHREEIEPNAS